MAAMAPRLSVTQAVWAKPAATFRATGAAPETRRCFILWQNWGFYHGSTRILDDDDDDI
jgi:hypothetical protein